MTIIRSAVIADCEAIAALLEEVDRYYGADQTQSTADRLPLIRDALFGTPPAAFALLAWSGDTLIGLASYSYLWPAAGVTRSLFLKELYVSETSRRHGIGRLLMAELCRMANASGCDRIEWTADTDNPVALRFYTTLGVPPSPSKQFYRLDGDDLLRMANPQSESVDRPSA